MAFRIKIALLLVAALVAAACATIGIGDSSRGQLVEEGSLDELEGPALLLLMADQLLFEPFAVRTIFTHHPELHERLAVALGRIGDARGVPYLETLLVDPVVEIRRAAAFGLGQVGERNAYPALLGALGDSDRLVGRLAVDGLFRLELPLARIQAALGVLPDVEIHHRLLPNLFRFTPDEIHRFEADLEAQSELGGSAAASKPASKPSSKPALAPELERWLLFAVARGGDARALPRLRAALGDRDPWVQGWAARGLGRLGEGSDLSLLRPLLGSPDSGVVVQALRAARSLVDAGRASPPESWLGDLEELVDDERSWVRLTALESAGSWALAPNLAARLRALASAEEGLAAELALVSLARGADVEARQLILGAAGSRQPSIRRAAARAASIADLDQVVERLRADAEPAVRIAALTATLGDGAGIGSGGFTEAEISAREALLDRDPGVRTVALEWLTSNPIAPLDELIQALYSAGERRLTELPDLEVQGAAAIAARAAAEASERGGAIATLERLAESAQYLLRRGAGEALVSLDRERPPLGTVASPRPLRAYRNMVTMLKQDRWVELVTERGRVVIRLDPRTAPLTCLSFVQLAQAGFFDGLGFHRVIADFVAQGGDPRGDGWGGPGFSLRDENSWIPFERGVVGMARSGTHTAGSQFFLTMSPQPHLNGRYTAFGRVVAGEEWLNSIEQGDRILSAREITDPLEAGAGFASKE